MVDPRQGLEPIPGLEGPHEGGDEDALVVRVDQGAPAVGQMAVGLDPDVLLSRSRTREATRARMVAMAVARRTGRTTVEIGQRFERDHTTVMYAERKINQLLGERRAVFNQVSELTNRVKMQARQG